MEKNKRNFKIKLDLLLSRLGLIKPGEYKAIKKVFIVSTGRTGTKFLARFLNQFEDCYCFHEPKPDFLKMAIKYTHNDISTARVRKKILQNRLPFLRDTKRKDCEFFIESNNRYFSLLKPLKEVFPKARIIHIIRDGRDYVRSGMNRDWYTEQDSEDRLKASDFPQDPCYIDWDEMSRFAKICWRWQKKDGFIYEAIKDMENVLTLKFREIFHKPDNPGLDRLIDFIGLDEKEAEKLKNLHINNKVNASPEHTISHWKNWSSERKQKFEEIAGDHMQKYYSWEW